jgi:hypothetical protein
MVSVVWAMFRIFQLNPNYFLSLLMTMTKPGYIVMTWRQSNTQWNGGIAVQVFPTPKNWSVKIMWKFPTLIFGIKEASSYLVIFQRSNLSTLSFNHLFRCNLRTFGRKTPLEGHQFFLFLHDNAPSHRAHYFNRVSTQLKLTIIIVIDVAIPGDRNVIQKLLEDFGIYGTYNRNKAYVVCKTYSDTCTKWRDWNHFKVNQKIR